VYVFYCVLALVDIEDKRARARDKERGKPAHERTAPGRLIEGHGTQGWKQALNALSTVFEGRIPEHIIWSSKETKAVFSNRFRR
jgi:putative transposase